MTGGMSQALNDAVDKAVKSGMHFAITAGNENNGVFSCSPAGQPTLRESAECGERSSSG